MNKDKDASLHFATSSLPFPIFFSLHKAILTFCNLFYVLLCSFVTAEGVHYDYRKHDGRYRSI